MTFLRDLFKADIKETTEDILYLVIVGIVLIAGIAAGILLTTENHKSKCDKYSTVEFYGKPYVCLELVK